MASIARTLRPFARAATTSSRSLRPAFTRTVPQYVCTYKDHKTVTYNVFADYDAFPPQYPDEKP
jgi:hypothetical protein